MVRSGAPDSRAFALFAVTGIVVGTITSYFSGLTLENALLVISASVIGNCANFMQAKLIFSGSAIKTVYLSTARTFFMGVVCGVSIFGYSGATVILSWISALAATTAVGVALKSEPRPRSGGPDAAVMKHTFAFKRLVAGIGESLIYFLSFSVLGILLNVERLIASQMLLDEQLRIYLLFAAATSAFGLYGLSVERAVASQESPSLRLASLYMGMGLVAFEIANLAFAWILYRFWFVREGRWIIVALTISSIVALHHSLYYSVAATIFRSKVPRLFRSLGVNGLLLAGLALMVYGLRAPLGQLIGFVGLIAVLYVAAFLALAHRVLSVVRSTRQI